MDLDGDGNLDILSGSYSRMEKDMAGLFQVLYGNKDGSFQKAKVLQGTDGKPLIIPSKSKGDKGDEEDQVTEKICTRPFAVDWDSDGKLDLVVGNFKGTFHWFKGKGKGTFDPKSEKILVDGEPLKIKGIHSDPFIVDWDGDGDMDLVTGSSDGGIYWAENKAGKGKTPVLKPLVALIEAAPTRKYDTTLREEEIKRPEYASRVWVADVNGDGKLDLLVGDSAHLIAPAKGLTEADMKKKLSEWQGAIQMASEAMSKTKDDKERAKLQKEYSKLYQKRSEIMQEERTGFVWLYLAK